MYLMDTLTDEVDVDRRNSAEWKHAVLNRCKLLERVGGNTPSVPLLHGIGYMMYEQGGRTHAHR